MEKKNIYTQIIYIYIGRNKFDIPTYNCFIPEQV